MKTVRILHLHSAFDLGGKEARAVKLMNHFGRSASHVVLSAVPGALGARSEIDAGIKVDFPGCAAPALHGKPAPGRYLKLARYMQQFDLVLSYNWGSMDGVMARTLLSPFIQLPPLVHHEDGFNEDEAEKLNWKRNAFRSLALKGAYALVVPSVTLEEIALVDWMRPAAKVHRISNGIDAARYQVPPAPDAFPRAKAKSWWGPSRDCARSRTCHGWSAQLRRRVRMSGWRSRGKDLSAVRSWRRRSGWESQIGWLCPVS
jgi:L-malate glycosyltransferase